jgi:DnaJ-class molecular chaperone
LGFAYETLSDEELRKVYDRGGEEAVTKKDGQQQNSNPFGSMFGGMFGQQREQEDQVKKGETIHMQALLLCCVRVQVEWGERLTQPD